MDDKTDYKDFSQNRRTRKRNKASGYWNDKLRYQLTDVNKADFF